MENQVKWEHMLLNIKKKGKKIKIIRKTVGIGMSFLILSFGILFFQKSGQNLNIETAQINEAQMELSYYFKEGYFYDDELGFIYE
ncbi:MAG TPA: hypothetical protein DHW82_03110 [Spirochaetia bacterium]|nr:MAG: hypothetical protein A2Y41_04010 [Spirochaetes bacterium GWB1_36_13]HCL55981.1 hypothetical protein [Spirochaetia bacterium]